MKEHDHWEREPLLPGMRHLISEIERQTGRPIEIRAAPAIRGRGRAIYAVTDCWWITVHVTASQDLEEIERQVIAPSYRALEEGR